MSKKSIHFLLSMHLDVVLGKKILLFSSNFWWGWVVHFFRGRASKERIKKHLFNISDFNNFCSELLNAPARIVILKPLKDINYTFYQ